MDPVLHHHLYEYEKGLRRLILHTVRLDDLPPIKAKLERSGVAYEVIAFGTRRANIFFGDEVCIEIVRSIGKANLSEYTPEEDFILGTMLGYCRRKQCERYLKLKANIHEPVAALAG